MKKQVGSKSSFLRRYLPEFVYGGMDGSVTTFAVVAGSIGASLSSVVVLILGFANLFADGFSMAVANYVSTKSRNELDGKNRKNEKKTAFATFFAFLLVGLIPLLSFVLAAITNNANLIQNQFKYSIILTGLAFIVVGWFRGDVTGRPKVKAALETFTIGTIASLLAFAVGHFLKTIIG